MSRAAAGQGRKKKHQPTRERIKFFFFSWRWDHEDDTKSRYFHINHKSMEGHNHIKRSGYLMHVFVIRSTTLWLVAAGIVPLYIEDFHAVPSEKAAVTHIVGQTKRPFIATKAQWTEYAKKTC
jgi:hypothetical protein